MTPALLTLARQPVEAQAFHWEAGMLVHSEVNAWDPMWNPGRLCRVENREPDDIPLLADPATAALLAVQAMERGAKVHPHGGRWRALWKAGHLWRQADGTLGEAAARALLAMADKGGDRG
jgi:hypothetical protein